MPTDRFLAQARGAEERHVCELEICRSHVCSRDLAWRIQPCDRIEACFEAPFAGNAAVLSEGCFHDLRNPVSPCHSGTIANLSGLGHESQQRHGRASLHQDVLYFRYLNLM